MIVGERAPGTHKLDMGPIADDIRAAIAVRHGVTVRDVLLTAAGAIPRTSSGKIGRRACRAAYLDGSLRSGKVANAFPRPDRLTADWGRKDQRTTGAWSIEGGVKMTDRQDDSQPADEFEPDIQLAPEKAVTPPSVAADAPRTDMTVAEMREWLRNWIANATGQSADAINESTPMVELGLSSRDAVAMASDIEDLTGVTLTATVAFRHPTIESLATVIVEGEPEIDMSDSGEDWSRDARG